VVEWVAVDLVFRLVVGLVVGVFTVLLLLLFGGILAGGLLRSLT